MVVMFTRLRQRLGAGLTAGLVALAIAPIPVMAQSSAAPGSLAEAWLSVLEAEDRPITWSYSVALRQETAAGLPARRARLVEELATLVVSARVAGNAPLAAGLARWAEALDADEPMKARTPGRFDLPWLGANLRRDPPLASLVHWGTCQVPDWVEVWSHAGVERRPWRPGLDLRALMGELPRASMRRADHAAVIDPLGQVHRLGIATWNRETAPLAPGSRVMVLLPEAQGLRGALPFPGALPVPGALAFPGTGVESELINQRLPAYLATRLPGDECRLQDLGEEG